MLSLSDRTFATNVPSVDHEEMPWADLVQRINPHLYELESSPSTSSAPLPDDDRFTSQKSRSRGAVRPESPSKSKRRGDSTAPSTTGTTHAQSAPVILPTKHNLRINDALDLMSRCLHWDNTRRITAAEALQHPFLYEEEEIQEDEDAEGEYDDQGWEGYDADPVTED